MTTNPLTRTLPRVASAAAALLFVAAATAAAAPPAPVRTTGAGPLRDLQLAPAQPTDGGTAQVLATESGGTTTVTLKVQGLDRAFAGSVLGAHVHTGTCVAGDGAAAGPHYNSTGGTAISDETEVWLDFTIDTSGRGLATARVPFTIPAGGAGAVVIHAAHPDHVTGAAGPRLACLPVQF